MSSVRRVRIDRVEVRSDPRPAGELRALRQALEAALAAHDPGTRHSRLRPHAASIADQVAEKVAAVIRMAKE